MWAKNELKEKFAGGISTTSRVESHHAIQKRHSTSNSGLQNVFRNFLLIENAQELTFKEEFQRHKVTGEPQDIELLEDIKKSFVNMCTKK